MYASNMYTHYEEGDPIQLEITKQTDLGFNVLFDDEHVGLLFFEDIFQPLRVGQRLPGFIKRIRSDGKIDVCLQRPGYSDCKDIGLKILERLKEQDGFLPVGDKSSAETVYDYFGVSKKKFKMAIGKLYKEKKILLDGSAQGIRLRS